MSVLSELNFIKSDLFWDICLRLFLLLSPGCTFIFVFFQDFFLYASTVKVLFLSFMFVSPFVLLGLIPAYFIDTKFGNIQFHKVDGGKFYYFYLVLICSVPAPFAGIIVAYLFKLVPEQAIIISTAFQLFFLVIVWSWSRVHFKGATSFTGRKNE